MIKGKTQSGFEFTVDPENLDDMEFIDAMVSLNDGNMFAMSTIANIMFDEAQKKALYEHLKKLDEKGKVRTTAFAKEIIDILNYSEETKN